MLQTDIVLNERMVLIGDKYYCAERLVRVYCFKCGFSKAPSEWEQDWKGDPVVGMPEVCQLKRNPRDHTRCAAFHLDPCIHVAEQLAGRELV